MYEKNAPTYLSEVGEDRFHFVGQITSMSFEWSSEALSLETIATQFTLPVVIRSAPGFRDSSRPILLYSIRQVSFAFGRALQARASSKSIYESYRPINSELVAVPFNYPGYFECILPSNRTSENVVTPETKIRSIVETMQRELRCQAFYVAAPLRVYTLETKARGVQHRLWKEIEPDQMILCEKLLEIEYTPTKGDQLTDEDYDYSWWACFGKRLINRHESVIQCTQLPGPTCYIPCSSTDDIRLLPVGQPGSTNMYKLQTLPNLLGQFPLPVDVKLAQLPGSHAYKDFGGNWQVRGSRTEPLAICASLTSSNIAAVHTNTSLKFLVAPVPPEMHEVLARCQIFEKSFDLQIRRLIVLPNETSSHRSRLRQARPKANTGVQRARSVDRFPPHDEQTMITDEGYRSGSSLDKGHQQMRRYRTASVDNSDMMKPTQSKRRLTKGKRSEYHSLVYPIQLKNKTMLSTPSLPAKPFTYDTGSTLVEELDAPNADGAILMDNNHEPF